MTPACPLCLATPLIDFHRDKRRDYYQCLNCALVFVPPDQHLDPAAEKAIYDLHQNQADDSGYRRFLSRLALPLLNQLPSGTCGLDYGCGPGPVLAAMLEAAGHKMTIYDPLYAPDPTALQQCYDFVSCSEVVEHFRQPALEFQRLFALLKPGGILAIMTKRVIDQAAFTGWHYKNDLTHIAFYSDATFDWLAKRYQAQVSYWGPDVAIFSL